MIYDYNSVIFRQTRDPDLNFKSLHELKIKMALFFFKTREKIELKKKRDPDLKKLKLHSLIKGLRGSLNSNFTSSMISLMEP